MLPVEAIVRGYITGSGWKDYQRDGTVSGIALPDASESPTSCPSRSSPPRPRRTSATTRRSTSTGAAELIGDRELTERLRRSRSPSTSTPPSTPASAGSSSPTRSSSSASTPDGR